MNDLFCPNLKSCSFINSDFSESCNRGKDFYLTGFCRSDNSNWGKCKRFQIKAILDFCPDFVLPDSQMDVDQIMDMFDEQNKLN